LIQSVIDWVVNMRVIPVLALLTSSLALAACGGGGLGTGSGTLGVETGVFSGCPLTNVNNNPDCPPPSTGTTDKPDRDGDGTPDPVVGEDGDGETGSGAGGNTTSLTGTNGTRTIVLRKSVYDKPKAGSVALSQITMPTLTADGTRDAILNGYQTDPNDPDSIKKPTQLTIKVDTKSVNNGQLAKPVVMDEYIWGTRDLRWLTLGHATEEAETVAGSIFDTAGNPLAFDRPSGRLIYTAADPDGNFAAGDKVDIEDDFYWNQLTPFMDQRANGGTGANYREYRALSESDNRDEVLQVWAWGNSYAAHYENAIGGGDPKHQAWTFAGKKATNVPTGGAGSYAGRFVATAKTSNWVKPDNSDIDPNALWMVQGGSKFNVDFDSSKVTGTLTPESWTSYQPSRKGYYTFNTASSDPEGTAVTGDDPSPTDNPAEPEFKQIYGTKIKINATLKSGGGAGAQKDVIVGTAKLTGDYVSGDNPVQAGLFGEGGSEMTGVFAVAGTSPDPLGGSTGITDNRRGYLSISGAFNATCVPGDTCAE
jgi:hypothetical protein